MGFDPESFVERAAAIERHLDRVDARRPDEPSELKPMTDATDAVILHLWQATQGTIDLAISACVGLDLGAPATYAEAFTRLVDAGRLEPALGKRLAAAAGFRNLLVHAYEKLDLAVVWQAATHGPADLRAFINQAATWVETP